ncbi:MAG: hypothetical protein HQ596_06180 [Candidatus Saganbacteria bacterium]|nr:hypothetical protein [Candidatus Saganbacteria bacterium]
MKTQFPPGIARFKGNWKTHLGTVEQKAGAVKEGILYTEHIPGNLPFLTTSMRPPVEEIDLLPAKQIPSFEIARLSHRLSSNIMGPGLKCYGAFLGYLEGIQIPVAIKFPNFSAYKHYGPFELAFQVELLAIQLASQIGLGPEFIGRVTYRLPVRKPGVKGYAMTLVPGDFYQAEKESPVSTCGNDLQRITEVATEHSLALEIILRHSHLTPSGRLVPIDAHDWLRPAIYNQYLHLIEGDFLQFLP